MTPQPQVYANSTTWLGCAIESAPGVPAAAPTFWVPVIDPVNRPTIDELEDPGIRGQMSAVWGQTQGPSYSVLEFKCLAHVDVLPHLLRSVLGSTDTVSGAAAPYTHQLSLKPNGVPPTYTWFDYDGFRIRRMRGGVTDRVVVSWRSDGLVELKVRVYAYPFTVVTGISPVIGSTPPAAGWNLTTTLDGTAKINSVSGSLTFWRHVAVIPTLGTQVPYSLLAGPLDLRGEVTVINQDDTELNVYLTNASSVLSLNFATLALQAYGFRLDMSACKASTGSEERGPSGLITAILSLLPLPNVADATAGGSSPVKATIFSPQAAAY